MKRPLARTSALWFPYSRKALSHSKYGLAVGLVAFVIGAAVYQKIVELEKRVKALEREVERRPLRD